MNLMKGYNYPARKGKTSSSSSLQLPEINVSGQELRDVTQLAIDALRLANEPLRLCLRSNRLRRLESDENDLPTLRPVDENILNYELARAANFIPARRGSMRKPPNHLAKDLLAHPNLPLPHVDRIVGVPVYGPDGRLQQKPGHHQQTRTLFIPDPDLIFRPIPDKPTARDLKTARGLILEDLFGDFPITGPADLAHLVSATLWPYVQLLITGPSPLHLVTKPVAGTGGTLALEIAMFPFVGRFPDLMTAPADESEWRRMLFSFLLTGKPICVLDNVSQLRSPALASVVTGGSITDRLIGSSSTATAPARCLFLASGNNLALSREFTRRVVTVRLDARTERPELRVQFRHPKLKEWAQAHRAELVWATLTVVQAWISAGRPPGKATMGMFESFAEVMSGILEVNGIPGFLANYSERIEIDSFEENQLVGFVTSWFGVHGTQPVSSRELLVLATGLDLGVRDEDDQTIRLGKVLHENLDRRFGDHFLRQARKKHNSQQWYLEKS